MKRIQEIESLVETHQIIKDFILSKQWERLNNFMHLFINQHTDINILKTILVATKSFKDNEEISEVRQKMLNIYNVKYAELDYE